MVRVRRLHRRSSYVRSVRRRLVRITGLDDVPVRIVDRRRRERPRRHRRRRARRTRTPTGWVAARSVAVLLTVRGVRRTILVRRVEGVGLSAGRVGGERRGSVRRVRERRGKVVVHRREDVRLVAPLVLQRVRRLGRDAATRGSGVVGEDRGDGRRGVVVAVGRVRVLALDVLRERRLAAEAGEEFESINVEETSEGKDARLAALIHVALVRTLSGAEEGRTAKSARLPREGEEDSLDTPVPGQRARIAEGALANFARVRALAGAEMGEGLVPRRSEGTRLRSLDANVDGQRAALDKGLTADGVGADEGPANRGRRGVGRESAAVPSNLVLSDHEPKRGEAHLSFVWILACLTRSLFLANAFPQSCSSH